VQDDGDADARDAQERAWYEERDDAEADDEVLNDHAAAAAGQGDGVRQLGQVVGHQGNIGRFECYVGACAAHGDADGRCDHGRRVVHAVADHDHVAVAFVELFDEADLVVGHQLGVDLVDA